MHQIVLGIDYGHVRIGIARAEAGVAYPFTTLHQSLDPTSAVLQLAARERATTLVVGLPRSLDGEDTIQTVAVRAFADSLAESGIAVALQDEAGSSSLAEDRLKARTKSYAKADIDAEAAAIILQDYLDNL